jgi:hypothetical protein
MAQQQISASTINAAIAALWFFFNVTLERPDLVRPLRTVTEPRKAPVVLSPEEVARLLEAAPSLKYKAALSVAYARSGAEAEARGTARRGRRCAGSSTAGCPRHASFIRGLAYGSPSSIQGGSRMP